MLLRYLGCFFAIIQTGWSANQYLFANQHHTTIATHHIPLQQHHRQSSAPIIYKTEYFFFSDPDEKADQSEELKEPVSLEKRLQQVVFIKNPENSAERALQHPLKNSLQQQQQQQNPHTYILSKEPNYAGLQQKFQATPKNFQAKPDARFIKYRNPLEFQRIQSQKIQQRGVPRSYKVENGYNIVRGNNFARSNKVVNPRSVASDNTPVSKNYAMNFLPTGVDVVPGSSYIPLIL